MGFAGQLFAARVAIGLAIPSPQALSKAGQQMAKGIGGMMTQIQLARKRGTLSSGLQSEFNQISQTAKTSLDKINNEIYIRVKRNMEALNKATSGGVAANYDRLSNSMQKLKRAMGSDKSSSAIFGGLQKGGAQGGGGMFGAGRLMQNIQKGGAANMQQVLQGQQRYVSALKEEMNIVRKLRDETDLKGKKLKAHQDLHDKRLHDIRKEINLQKELTTYLNQQTGQLGAEGAQVEDITTKWQGYAEKGLEKAQEAKNKMNESIRTSISLLTVLGYKLNQNAQELVEFERELLNANSVFNLTNDNLYEVGNTITEFGNRFGIAVQNGATGLYQLASAGVSATEALSILPETLKLSMAVQGDHNTISKLTAQTLFGFGMEMNQAAEVTDKFAYAIQKSLIEYQDLSSAVKFALPFFTSTGQSIDQLLGALQILTNRALEAGIAGRGLRQALAEFAESAMDAEAGFRKMGVEILNANGEMMQLTEIAAQFASAVGPETASNTELLTTLIEELNVRGATAFIHLVQASDEFTQAVEDTTNAGGQLDEMVKIQNESLGAQIQIIKNNIFSIFGFRDATYEGTEYLNQFHEALINSVQSFKDLIIVEEQGKQKLTEFGMKLQTFATDSLVLIVDLLHRFVMGMVALSESGFDLGKTMEIIATPLKWIIGAFEKWPNLMKFVIWFKAWNTVLPMTTGLIWGLNLALSGTIARMAGLSRMQAFGALNMGGLSTAMLFGGRGGGGAGGAAMLGGGAAKGLGRKMPLDYGKSGRAGLTPFNWGTDISGKRYGAPGYTDTLHGNRRHKDMKTALNWRKMFGKGMDKGSYLARFIPGYGTMIAMMMKMMGKAAGKAGGGYISPMSGGGMAGAGSPYLVGEQGPELFVPSQGGQVLNTASTSNIGGNMQFRNVTIGIDSFGGLA